MLHRASGVYDGIDGHDPGELEKIIIDLKRRRFNMVSLHQVVEAVQGRGTLPCESVAFTVDDGYCDQLEVIAPIFAEHEVPVTLFLTTGFLNGELWPWDAKIRWLIQHTRQSSLEMQIGLHRLKWPLGNKFEKLTTRRELQAICATLPGQNSEWFLHALEDAVGVELPDTPPREFSPATWDQVRLLEKSGVRFAPHTHSHRILSRLQESEVRYELSRSLEILVAETSYGLPVFAYPVGMEQHFGLREMRLAEEAGYAAAFAVLENYTQWSESLANTDLRYCFSRIGLPHSRPAALWFASGLQALRERSGNAAGVHRLAKEGKVSSLNKGFDNNTLRSQLGELIANFGRFNCLKRIHPEIINRLVFVCRGNVCRSPYAELAAKSLGLSAISCGVDVTRSVTAEAMAIRSAFLRGKDLSRHMSRSIFDVPLSSSDCLVVMDPSQLPAARNVATRTGCQFTLLGLWKSHAVAEIPDPYGKPLGVYSRCFNYIDSALSGLVTWIEQSTARSNIK
jgi:protein-tyrosine-phosphatase/peptidoglycan/xylan/chitin deacetylase (PgdA/CDA1 family)